MQTLFRQIPKTAPAAVPQEPARKGVLPRRKFNPWPALIVLILTGLIIAHFLTDGKSQEDQFRELSAKKEAGQYLTSGEETDFCELLFLLRDSVSTECIGVLDGINWDNPPKSPEGLSEDWEEITPPNVPDKHRFFRHKIYPQIEISFDKGNPNAPPKAHKAKDHWHRLNPNSRSKADHYLDKNGNTVSYGHKNSHIEPRK